MNTLGIQRSLRNSRETGYQNSGSTVLFVQILCRNACWNLEREEICNSPALLPLDAEVHAHGDGELLVVNGEDVQDLHVDVHIDGAVRDGGLELLVILGQTPAQDTLGHSCNVELYVSICLSFSNIK